MSDASSYFTNEQAIDAERLELALQASNEGIWDWWTHETEIYYSRRILEFLECNETNAPNLFLPPYESVHEQDRQRFQELLEQALAVNGPKILAVDARVQISADMWRWLRIRGTVVRDSTGACLRIAGSMIDISQRKQAEAQLEEERFLLRSLIDRVPLQIYFKNRDSEMVMVNQRMAEWNGFESVEQMIGKHDRNLFEEEHWRPAEADEQWIMRTGQPITSKLEEETWHEKDQTWVITSKFPWCDSHGNIKGTFGVSSDVTQLVKARQQATRLAAELQLRNQAYEEELHLAREIQQAFSMRDFPQIAAQAGGKLNFSARYIPISGLAGDFYEVIEIRPDCAGVLICDVMGHGVRSALIVAMLRGLLEKQRSQASDPGLFLAGLNEGLAAMLERAGATMFATAFYGVVDLAAGTLRYACAGHPGPVMVKHGKTEQLARERQAKGPGLGLMPGASYPVSSSDLQDMSRLILFTDGLLEAEDASGEPFFTKRLTEIVAAGNELSLDDLLDGVLNRVLKFSDAHQFDDDVCLLGLELQQPK